MKNSIKLLFKVAFPLAIGIFFVFLVPGKVLALEAGNLELNKIYRYDEIFNLNTAEFAKNNDMDVKDVGYDCVKLNTQIDKINLKINEFENKLEVETYAVRLEQYEAEKNSYVRLLAKYRNYVGNCVDKAGATPPDIGVNYVAKKGEYDDIRIVVEDRGESSVKILYTLDEDRDLSLSATLLITKLDISFPYSQIKDTEHYTVSFKVKEQSLYLKGNFASYKDYYLYVIPTFNTTDFSFTTRKNTIIEELGDDSISKFSDLKRTNIYYLSIKEALNKGIIQGYQNLTFRPSNLVSRKEFLKIAINSKYIDLSIDDTPLPFRDVERSDWAFPYLKTALEQRFIVNATSFYPNRGVSLIEGIKILSKVLQIDIGSDMTKVNGLSTNHWAIPYVNYFFKNGLIAKTTTDFDIQLKRDQAVDLIMKTINSLRG